MDAWFTEGNNKVDLPITHQNQPWGARDGLEELLWRNGGAIPHSQAGEDPTNTVPWTNYPFNGSFDNNFSANMFSENLAEHNKIPGQAEGVGFFEFGVPYDNHFFPIPHNPQFNPIPFTPPRFESTYNLPQAPFGEMKNNNNDENVAPPETRMHCNETDKLKGKMSDATQLESAARNKSTVKTATARRSRALEVHNQSERRRRDKINERMRTLQELIPHYNKSLGIASVLDEAIIYLKSLQLQLQFMCMRSGMPQMMVPGMQQYMPRIGMGIGLPMSFKNPTGLPLVDQAVAVPNQATIGENLLLNQVYYNQNPPMLSPDFWEQYTNYMDIAPMQNNSQNQVFPRPGNGNGYMGYMG